MDEGKKEEEAEEEEEQEEMAVKEVEQAKSQQQLQQADQQGRKEQENEDPPETSVQAEELDTTVVEGEGGGGGAEADGTGDDRMAAPSVAISPAAPLRALDKTVVVDVTWDKDVPPSDEEEEGWGILATAAGVTAAAKAEGENNRAGNNARSEDAVKSESGGDGSSGSSVSSSSSSVSSNSYRFMVSVGSREGGAAERNRLCNMVLELGGTVCDEIKSPRLSRKKAPAAVAAASEAGSDLPDPPGPPGAPGAADDARTAARAGAGAGAGGKSAAMAAHHRFDGDCTHVVMTSMKRTEKYLGACAAGLWVLRAAYLADSLAAGRFLPEEPYEWGGGGGGGGGEGTKGETGTAAAAAQADATEPANAAGKASGGRAAAGGAGNKRPPRNESGGGGKKKRRKGGGGGGGGGAVAGDGGPGTIWSGSCRRWRLHVAGQVGTGKPRGGQGVFAGWHVAFVGETVPPVPFLRRVLEAGGGTATVCPAATTASPTGAEFSSSSFAAAGWASSILEAGNCNH
eukprot:g4737.t1